jgi:DNA-binding IclR family transcriptional regulator
VSQPAPEEKQKAYFERARKGMLAWLSERGGSATLAEMHSHSEQKFLIAHQGFSRMMESLVDEGLVAYDHGTGTATLTDAGKTFIGR